VRNSVRINSGFTLIEVLIGITMSLLVISAATTFYQRTITESRKIKDSAMLQETAFFTAHMISQHFRQAGYKGIDPSLIAGREIPIPANAAFFPEVGTAWKQGQFIKADQHSISMRFNGSSDTSGMADGSMVDCSGNAIPNGTIAENTLTFTKSRIICTSGAIAQTLVGSDDGLAVSEMILSFGIDDGSNGSIDRYVPSKEITTADLTLAREILMNILLVSHRNIDAAGKQYQFNNSEYDYPDNRYRREIVVRTALRNL